MRQKSMKENMTVKGKVILLMLVFLTCNGQFWEYCYSQKDPLGDYIIPLT